MILILLIILNCKFTDNQTKLDRRIKSLLNKNPGYEQIEPEFEEDQRTEQTETIDEAARSPIDCLLSLSFLDSRSDGNEIYKRINLLHESLLQMSEENQQLKDILISKSRARLDINYTIDGVSNSKSLSLFLKYILLMNSYPTA